MREQSKVLACSVGWSYKSLATAVATAADADQAILNLERWLVATGNVRLNAEELAGRPAGWARFMRVLGASQPLAETLIQNPELAHLLLSPAKEDLLAEGRRLLTNAPSYSYRLDRLRYLKQRGMVSVVANDLDGGQPPQATWRALSDLADTLTFLAYETAWNHHAQARGLDYPCPVGIIAFGKHGGREVNYNSDLDFTYVLKDGATEAEEKEAHRFAEAFGRVFTERMGRGILYRIDLRLRPYGSTGALVPSMRATESYYANHAENWEAMALIRSRFVIGPPEIADRWATMRDKYAFPRRTLDSTVQETLRLRDRIESEAPADDIKRGLGGIRDPEFASQLLQMIYGHQSESLRTRETGTALQALADFGLSVDPYLAVGYQDLRRLEHYLQLRNDTQTHRLPSAPREQTAVSRLMGWPDDGLIAESDALRARVRAAYRATVGEGLTSRPPSAEFSPFEAEVIHDWFNRLPEGDTFRRQLDENSTSAQRVARIARVAPRLARLLSDQVSVTELIISGEIEEEVSPSPVTGADQYRRLVAAAITRAVLSDPSSRICLEEELTVLADRLIQWVAREVGLRAHIYGLGSVGNRLMAPNSDADLLFLADTAIREAEEKAASKFLRWFQENPSLSVDLRLRPDGGKGLLVRTPSALRYYADTDMDTWERFALGHARPLSNRDEIELIYEIAYAGVSDADLSQLAAMKGRIETERVEAQHGSRNVKLGPGGLLDIEWLVHLCEMRYSTAMDVVPGKPFRERILSLNAAGLLNALETEVLDHAHRWLLDLRVAIWLQGIDGDVLPENPDRLDRIAEYMGDNNGNETLANHATTTKVVRQLYEMGWEILAR